MDLMVDESGKAWLLEVETIPSTSAIGPVDDKLKRIVLRISSAHWLTPCSEMGGRRVRGDRRCSGGYRNLIQSEELRRLATGELEDVSSAKKEI